MEPLTEDELMVEQERVTAHRVRGMFFLCLAVGAVGFTVSLNMGLNANFLRDALHLEGQHVGYLESVREVCGLTAFLLLALLAGFAEPLVGAAVLTVFGLGLGSYAYAPTPVRLGLDSYAYAPTLGWLVVASLVWSQGLHIWMPLPNSMTLALAEPGRSGRRLGQVGAAGAAGSAIGLLAALALDKLGMSIRHIYFIAGSGALLGALFCLGIPRAIKTPGPRLVFRRQYKWYYLLCFMEGLRKQIAIAFAGFLLVKKFNTPLSDLLTLWICVNGISWLSARRVGHLIDRVGERPVLFFYYSSLIFLFIGYAFAQSKYLLYGVFVLDNSFFVFAMALNTYVGKIAPKSEYTPTLSMGVAMNHIAAVTMPLVGGLLWQFFSYKWTFLVGVAAAAASLIPVALLPSIKHPRHG